MIIYEIRSKRLNFFPKTECIFLIIASMLLQAREAIHHDPIFGHGSTRKPLIQDNMWMGLFFLYYQTGFFWLPGSFCSSHISSRSEDPALQLVAVKVLTNLSLASGATWPLEEVEALRNGLMQTIADSQEPKTKIDWPFLVDLSEQGVICGNENVEREGQN